jgi:hypothetical protein
MAASENLSPDLACRCQAPTTPSLYRSTTTASRVVSRIDCSLASSWFGISLIEALASGHLGCLFDLNEGTTIGLCNKASSNQQSAIAAVIFIHRLKGAVEFGKSSVVLSWWFESPTQPVQRYWRQPIKPSAPTTNKPPSRPPSPNSLSEISRLSPVCCSTTRSAATLPMPRQFGRSQCLS